MENSLQSSYITSGTRMAFGHYDVLSALQSLSVAQVCQSPLCCPLDWGWGFALVSLSLDAYEDIGLANPEAQIHTVTTLDAARRLGSCSPHFIANVVIDFSKIQLSLWSYVDKHLWPQNIRALAYSRHTLRDGHYSGAELGNAQDYLLSNNYPEINKQDHLPEKIVIITISKQKILVTWNGLWFKERKHGPFVKNLKSFSKLHFPLDFFFLKKWYHISI